MMLEACDLAGLWKTMKIEGIMTQIPKKFDFTPIIPRFWPDFRNFGRFFKILELLNHLSQKYVLPHKLKLKRCTLHICYHLYSILFQFSLIIIKKRKKRQNCHNRETRENRGKLGKFCIFCKKKNIYIEIHILTKFENDTCLSAIDQNNIFDI